MKTDRLLLLAKVLEEDANNPTGARFDLEHWLSQNRKDASEPGFNCGTQACAFGLATLIPEFQQQGLQRSFAGDPVYKGAFGFDAAEHFFGITSNESWFLFNPDFYPKKKRKGRVGELEAAKRIRAFVADRSLAEKRRRYAY